MEFTQEDFNKLLTKINENSDKMSLLLDGWNKFKDQIQQQNYNLKGYSNSNKENNQLIKYNNVTIKKHKIKNLWYTRIRINGKQKYISAKNQNECLRKLKEIIKERDNKTTEQLYNQNYTLETWFNEWLKVYKVKSGNELKQTTIKDYEKMTKHFNKYKDIKLDKFNNLMLSNLLNDIPYPRTRQKMFETLKQLFKKAQANNIIKNNPMQDIEKPKYTCEEKTILNEKEEKLFIEECYKNKIGDFCLICLFQGLRRGECLALTRADIDFINKTITINKSINPSTTETNTKNDYSNRIIPIFSNAEKILENYKNLAKEERLFNFSQSVINKNFEKIRKKLNLKITIHSLRHNFITKCSELGIQEHIIQKIVGHAKDSRITKKVYTHVREKAFLEAIDKLNLQ